MADAQPGDAGRLGGGLREQGVGVDLAEKVFGDRGGPPVDRFESRHQCLPAGRRLTGPQARDGQPERHQGVVRRPAGRSTQARRCGGILALQHQPASRHQLRARELDFSIGIAFVRPALQPRRDARGLADEYVATAADRRYGRKRQACLRRALCRSLTTGIRKEGR